MKLSAKLDVKKMVFTALMAALSVVLSEFLSFKVPVMPSFISFDFSDVPAVLASLTMGPLSGVCVCLIKNLEGLFSTMTGGVGELSNFILCCAFVFPAGLIYKKHKSKKGAVLGALAGAAASALISVVTNYFIVYPFYTAFMPMENIIAAYRTINPNIENLLQALVCFNLPFTFVKCMCSVIITVIIYKKISPLLKGENR